MRSHLEIIDTAGAATLAAKLGVSVHTVRSWRQRRSIPHEQWSAIIAADIATLAELSPNLAAAAKRGAA